MLCLFEESPNALFEASYSVWGPLKWDEPWQAMLSLPELLQSIHPFTCQKISFFSPPLPGNLQFWCFKTPHEMLNSLLTPARLISGCQISDEGLGFYPCWEMNRIGTSGKWEREISSFSPALLSGFTPQVRLWTKWLFINFQLEIITLMQVLKGFYFSMWDEQSFSN